MIPLAMLSCFLSYAHLWEHAFGALLRRWLRQWSGSNWEAQHQQFLHRQGGGRKCTSKKVGADDRGIW